MELNILWRSLFILALNLNISFPIAAQVNFQEIKLEEAEKILSEEKLPYILYFAGDWCPSCKTMEETTFKDTKLADRINSNYLAYKIDVDKADGKSWMKMYAVSTLPTILFYSKKSKLKKRLEVPITASKFLELTESSQGKSEFVKLKIKKALPKEEEIAQKSYMVAAEYKAPKSVTPIKSNTKYNQLLAQTEKIIDFLQLEPPKQNGQQYIVEIGKYKNVRTVERFVQFLKNRVDYPIKVLIEKEGNIPVQVVYLGEFKTKEAATKANQHLGKIQRKGLLRKF